MMYINARNECDKNTFVHQPCKCFLNTVGSLKVKPEDVKELATSDRLPEMCLKCRNDSREKGGVFCVLCSVCPVFCMFCILCVLYSVCPVCCVSCILCVLYSVCPVWLISRYYISFPLTNFLRHFPSFISRI